MPTGRATTRDAAMSGPSLRGTHPGTTPLIILGTTAGTILGTIVPIPGATPGTPPGTIVTIRGVGEAITATILTIVPIVPLTITTIIDIPVRLVVESMPEPATTPSTE